MQKAGEKSSKWRNDIHSPELPTVDRVVICAEDPIQEQGIFALVVYHVRAFPDGQGFKACLRYVTGHGFRRTSDVHLGTDEAAFNRARDEGLKFLKDEIEAIERDLTRYASPAKG